MQASLPPFVVPIGENARMEETLPKALGRRIKEARERAGLIQRQLGEMLGFVDHSAIGQWERGEVLPETENLIFCAEFCSASLDHLVWGMGNDIDARIRALPGELRDQLTNEFMLRIEQAERLAKEHPEIWTEESVKDADSRLKPWSAKRKQEYAKGVAKRKGGTQ